jgi:hypothetical protein
MRGVAGLVEANRQPVIIEDYEKKLARAEEQRQAAIASEKARHRFFEA